VRRPSEISAPAEIRSLRLTCRAVSVVADEYSIDELIVCYLRESLENAAPESETGKKTRRGIRKLHFNAERLLQYPTYSDCDVKRRDFTYHPYHYRSSESQGNLTTAELATAYGTYGDLYKNEATLAEDGTIHVNLCEVFKASPKLGTVAVSYGNIRRDCGTFREPAYHEAMIHAPHEPDQSPDRFEAFRETLLAAHDAEKRLQCLYADNIPHHFFVQFPGVIEKSDQVSRGLEDVELQLRSLERKDVIWGWDRHGEILLMLEDLKAQGVVRFLSACTRLKRVQLHHLPIDEPEYK